MDIRFVFGIGLIVGGVAMLFEERTKPLAPLLIGFGIGYTASILRNV